ncbi:hypothetical protein N7495_004159 [Penicillium taxi]|uniref:uncharacterized protein n=1 Tax=Penicillium taxi TaxID=168475 RepID=UPI0025458FB9|nr:uncharacterized protein N7495_004159 [Penicillium taxi]KAJ5899415.1 hypothetical protein N7495_004159 [Penicillium taxi]
MSTNTFELGDDDDSPLPVWGPGKTAIGRARLPSSRRRDRVQLSCDLCRRRKLHCDRQQPCATCTQRGLGLSCTYRRSPQALEDGTTQPVRPVTTVQDRIKQLEELVVDLMQKTSAANVPNPSSSANTPLAAVLDSIAELKDYFDRDDEARPHPLGTAQPPQVNLSGPQLIHGFTKVTTRDEILASIPPRHIVDRLVSRYFNSFEMSPDMVSNFRLRIVQCLILGDYTKGGVYVLETLLLYMAVELFLRRDAEIGIWILLGIIVQLSMHMGYHRDPKNFRGISPFDGEMRKRAWATILEVQLGISMQMGLPRLITQWQTNTTEPSNLQGNDFKDTVSMPASRPETDLTPMVFRIVKASMMTVIGYIWDFAADTRVCSREETERMEKSLRDARASVPECLQWRSMADCIMDSPHVIMQKICLEIMFYRAELVLHRKYLHLSQSNVDYNQSQTACLNAALKLLAYQQMLEEETQPFCQLHHERWKVSSLVNHDFLLATSVICLYLKQSAGDANTQVEFPTVHDIRTALNQAYGIWLQSSDTSREAWKAAKALSIVLLQPGSGNVRHDEQPLSSLDVWGDYFEQFVRQSPPIDGSVLMDWPFANNDAMYTASIQDTPQNLGWPMKGSQIVFPATGYISMAVEAVAVLAREAKISLVFIDNLQIGRAMAFKNDDASMEMTFELNIKAQSDDHIEAYFSCSSGSPHDHKTVLALNASGVIRATLGDDVTIDRFYTFLSSLGYYSWPFRGTAKIQRKAGYATGIVEDASALEQKDELNVHPSMLYSALQTTFATFLYPGDERMWALHVPTNFSSIVINPYYTPLGTGKQK